MTDTPDRPPNVSPEDWNSVDVPELTDEQFARAQPLKSVQPDLLQAWRRSRGRPTINDEAKKHIGFRLAADLVDSLKASGKGYNARVEKVLRDALEKGLL